MPGPGPGVLTGLGVRGIIGRFYRRFEEQLSGSWATRVGLLIPSDQETETYKLAGMAPPLNPWLGHRDIADLRLNSFTITNVEYQAATGITAADWRRDKTAQLAIRVGDLARRAATHWETLVSTLITDNTVGGAYDGQDFFDTDHSLGDSGTLNNEVTSTEVPALNVTDASAPTEDEMVDVLVGLVQEFYTYKDDKGEPINGDAMMFDVMVTPNLMGATQAAIRSSLRKSGSSSALPLQEFSLGLIVNPRLTSTSVVYVFRTDTEMKPFILQDEFGPQMEVKGEGSDYAFDNGAYAFGVCATRAAGYGEYLHAIKGTLS